MCSPSPPPAPDPVATANAQGAANEQAARVQGHINNPNVVGPTGSRTVTWNGDDPTVTNTLSPAEQAILEQSQQNRTGLGALAGQGINSLRGTIGQQLDLSSAPAGGTAFQNQQNLGQVLDRNSLPAAPSNATLPAMPSASDQLRQRVIDAQMARSDSAINRQQDQTNSDLIARGIRPGTEAYAREMDALNRERVDARQQAEANATNAVQSAFGQDLARRQQGFSEGMGLRNQATAEQAQGFNQAGQNAQEAAALQSQNFNQSNEARRQAIAEILARRQVPLNEITALMSGSQTGGASAGGPGNPGWAGSTVAPSPVFGALQNQQQYNTDVYNQQVSQSNANTQAGASIAAAAIAAMF